MTVDGIEYELVEVKRGATTIAYGVKVDGVAQEGLFVVAHHGSAGPGGGHDAKKYVVIAPGVQRRFGRKPELFEGIAKAIHG